MHCSSHLKHFKLSPNVFPDSEKCSTPAPEDGRHFNIPLFPYSWSGYSGSELRHLVQGPYQRHHVQGHREPNSPVSIYGAEDSGAEPLYAQRGPGAGRYYSSAAHQLRRMRDADELYLDVKQKPRAAEIKSENDFICSNFESSGSYKCIKCCKVRFSEFYFSKTKHSCWWCWQCISSRLVFDVGVYQCFCCLDWFSLNLLPMYLYFLKRCFPHLMAWRFTCGGLTVGRGRLSAGSAGKPSDMQWAWTSTERCTLR